MNTLIEDPDLQPQSAARVNREERPAQSFAEVGQSHIEALVSFSKKFLWPVLLLLALTALAHLSPLPLGQIFMVLWSAILLATIISPAAAYMQNRWHVPRWATPLGIYVGFIVLLAGAIALVIPLAVHEVHLLSHDLPVWFEKLRPWLQKVAPGQAEKFTTENLVHELSGRLQGFADVLGSTLGFVLSGSVKMLLILFMALFMVADTRLVRGAVDRFVPEAYSDTILGAMSDIGDRISKWARARMLLALFFGVAFGLGSYFIGLKYALTFAVAGAILEAIPYVGGAVTLSLALLVAITQGSTLQVILTVILYVVVVEIQAHVLEPKLMDKFLHMSPILVIFALFVGEETMGVRGAVFGIPLMIIVLEIVGQFFPARRNENSQPATQKAGVTKPPAAAPQEVVSSTIADAPLPEPATQSTALVLVVDQAELPINGAPLKAVDQVAALAPSAPTDRTNDHGVTEPTAPNEDDIIEHN